MPWWVDAISKLFPLLIDFIKLLKGQPTQAFRDQVIQDYHADVIKDHENLRL